MRFHTPPRYSKSLMVSIHNPAYYLGHYPREYILQVGHSLELSREAGGQVRDIVADDLFRWLHPNVYLRADRKASGNWWTNHGGRYVARSVKAGSAGRGGHMGVMDDPLSEQDAFSDKENAFVNRWYTTGFLTRLQPNATQTLMMTRWRADDLAGHVEKLYRRAGLDPFTVIKVPGICTAETVELLNATAAAIKDPRRFKVGDASFPEFWPLDHMKRQQAIMPHHEWSAQYQQEPLIEEGAILKRPHWRPWERDQLPDIDFVVQYYDTAFEDNETADYTARITWGLFQFGNRTHAIMLEAWRGQVSFPDLRKLAYQAYKQWEPDVVLVEKKASGHSLLQELRKKGVPVKPWPTGKLSTRSKVGRAHNVSVVLEQGAVWYPLNRQWAQDVIDECAAFPNGDNDDFVDCCTGTWSWMRKNFWLDLEDEDDEPMPKTLPTRTSIGPYG